MRCRALKIDATDSLRTSSAVVHFFPVGLSDPEGEITGIGRHFHCQESPPFSAIWTSSAPSDYLRERSRIMRMWSRILSSLASPSPHSRHLDVASDRFSSFLALTHSCHPHGQHRTWLAMEINALLMSV